MGPFILMAMSWLNAESTASDSFSIIPFTESTNGENVSIGIIQPAHICPHWCLPPRQQLLQVSLSASPNLSSIIFSVWIYHRPWIDTSSCVFGTLPPWHTHSLDPMCPKWIRVYPHTHLGYKSCFLRWMILSRISLWHAITCNYVNAVREY